MALLRSDYVTNFNLLKIFFIASKVDGKLHIQELASYVSAFDQETIRISFCPKWCVRLNNVFLDDCFNKHLF
jgi:hypothetical protein